MQRLETLRDKVMPFKPDLVIYSATTNDIRLMEIHLCEIAQEKCRPEVRLSARGNRPRAAVDDDDLRVDSDGEMVNKARLKRKLAARLLGSVRQDHGRDRRGVPDSRQCRWRW